MQEIQDEAAFLSDPVQTVFLYSWVHERISLSEENLVPRTYRLPKQIVDYLDTLENRSAFVVESLRSAITEHQLLSENSSIGRAKAIMQIENQLAGIEEEPVYRDAVKGLQVLSIPDAKKIHWFGEIRNTTFGTERLPTSKEHAEVGSYAPNPPHDGIRFTPEAFDRYTTMGKEYYTRIASDYKTRINQLVEKREKLKAEVVNTSE
jgi:hypothetical protein